MDDARALLDQERRENDVLWSGVDVTAPLDVEMHKESWNSWNKYIGSLAGRSVLDIGCGAGLWTVWLASQGAMVTAIDLSPVGVAKTMERAAFHGLEGRVRAYCADACHLDTVVAPGSIDLTLGFSVLHHLPAREFGASLRSVLKPGGYAVFFENSNANPLYRWARRIRNSETAAGSPLTAEKAHALISEIGSGELVYPHFKLFDAAKRYVFRGNRPFAAVMQAIDDAIDAIPGSRRWSSGMWVIARKPASSGGAR
jgi:SAM-dependent methyltransferase